LVASASCRWLQLRSPRAALICPAVSKCHLSCHKSLLV
jgi:hypothetical protein